ncbi:hypothetical protein ACR77J_07900 [Tissierella praeacuta]|uniref:hypothetical protein n=1 Tax=Tissierella praeacuta TaxID=43131 RepID=UPI003DA31336
MKNIKKLTMLLIVLALFVPTLRVNYFNGDAMEIRKYSIAGLIIQDIKDGTLGTEL